MFVSTSEKRLKTILFVNGSCVNSKDVLLASDHSDVIVMGGPFKIFCDVRPIFFRSARTSCNHRQIQLQKHGWVP